MNQRLYLFLSLKYTDIDAVPNSVKTNGDQMKTNADLSTTNFITYAVQFNGK